jgi:hypothetical protein
MKRISFFTFFFFISLWCTAQSDSLSITVLADSTLIELPKYKIFKDTIAFAKRGFSKPVIENFKADDNFQYGRPKQGLTAWQRFLIWMATLIASILEVLTNTTVGQIVFYGTCLLILLWVILKLLKIDAKDLFYNRAGKNSLIITGAENIHEVDFEKELHRAAAEKKYREAVRLMFLFALKKLADAHLIKWIPGKTNDEYLFELRQHASRSNLQDLRYYFEYSWYGHFEVTEQTYQHIKGVFQEFKSKLP